MGAWSTTIMGNDNALDIEANIYNLCDVEMYPEDSSYKSLIPKEKLEVIQSSFIDKYTEEPEGAIVLSVVMMEHGAAISEEVKEVAITNANLDEWAEGDTTRAKHVRDFITTLEKYDNQTPTFLTQEGLFQKIAEKIAKGEGGLVNLYFALPNEYLFAGRVNRWYLKESIKLEAESNPSLKETLTKLGFYDNIQ